MSMNTQYAFLKRQMVMCLLTGAVVVGQGNATELEICTALDCQMRVSIPISDSDSQQLGRLFTSDKGAVAERQAIRKAIAQMEKLAGRFSMNYLDLGRNPGALVEELTVDERQNGWPLPQNRRQHDSVTGQLDCVAESHNTSRFLQFFQTQGWLRYHQVRERAFRSSRLFGQHWSALIEELASGNNYVVDSWYLDNGEQPHVLLLQDWLRDKIPTDAF